MNERAEAIGLKTRHIAAVAALGVLIACSRRRAEETSDRAPQVSATRPAVVSAKKIGDGCEESDGWTRAQIPVHADLANGAPVADPVPEGYVDYPQLRPGVGYCLVKSLGYPNGYYTMNCASDADCPSPSRCDDKRCRAPCTQDTDCAAPMTCLLASDPKRVSYCIHAAAIQEALDPDRFQ